jgi:hypothetical protein
VSRVLLFVGDPPKVRKSFGPSQGWNRARAHAYATRVADRWWLVECENAKHGRGLIALVNPGAMEQGPVRPHPRQRWGCGD